MKTVTTLHAICDRENIVNLFAKFASRYGTLWTNRLGANGDWNQCIDDWHHDLSQYDYKTLVQATKTALSTYKDFPPTFGQFDELCKKCSGFLQVDEAIRLMIDRDFCHPIIKIMFDEIGSWALKNGTEVEVQKKAREAYKVAVAAFELDGEQLWIELEAFNAKPKELPPPPKIPTNEQRRSFKERLAEYQQRVEDAKLACKGMTYKHFDENKITPSNLDFDPKVYEEFREYLLSIPEENTVILPPQYIYRRRRFLNELERPELLRKAGYNPNPQGFENEPPRRSNGPQKVYKDWTGV